MQKEYATDRLLLKVLDKSQADQVLDYYIRNRDFLEEWEAEKGEEFYSAACQEQLLEKDFTDISNRSSLRLWIYKKDDSKRIIGTLAFTNIVRGVFLSCFLGYKLDQGEINKGFMTEAVRKGIQIMFEEYGLHRIEANIMPKNARSLKVAEKLGFYNEGFARNYLKINGQWEDHIHMVLLNERMHT
ncbi:GNAT family N-acetyltransferase [Anaerocolumna sp. AGMB13025]|uniref:GNAT family N-acetyltransferase n=1 Tax=Anaerocolumna sp. AGMB13025 TaxID=3039116 RepID=UPI00241EA9EE|nr:GNAT family N-acetyltransferase [Anaerocolumna sp. AGMB13025]WFR56167.1 GNAT family N-acetyltransferase [Anaerocolumna sp. AGMB13025]